MIITSNLDSPDGVPVSPPGTPRAAAIDVEWSKNYRVRGGNVPFCYSVTWLTLPREHIRPGVAGFWYTSVYVQDTSETGDLVASADRALRYVLDQAGLIAGHQLSSDLAVLAATARAPHPGITAAQAAWRQRRQHEPGGPADQRDSRTCRPSPARTCGDRSILPGPRPGRAV